MTRSSSVESRQYYRKRGLPIPTAEYRPDSAEQFCDALDDLHQRKTPWSILGDGQHSRAFSEDSEAKKEHTVIRTENLDGIDELDEESGLIRVQAGMRWKELHSALQQEGFSLQRYGLHPASATIGGMLARVRPGPPVLRGGALLDGCISIGAHTPTDGDYRYLVAPRKASGPDLRYEFIGAGGARGAILDATLVIWRPVAQRLLRYHDCSLCDAATKMRELFRAGITPSCVHYSYSGRSLQLILTAPGQLLRSRMHWIAEHLGAPDETGDTEAASTRRAWLEARHPDRRSHPDARRTRVIWLTPSALQDDPEPLFGDGVSDVEIVTWTPRRVEAFVRYGEHLAETALTNPPNKTCWADWPLVPLQRPPEHRSRP